MFEVSALVLGKKPRLGSRHEQGELICHRASSKRTPTKQANKNKSETTNMQEDGCSRDSHARVLRGGKQRAWSMALAGRVGEPICHRNLKTEVVNKEQTRTKDNDTGTNMN